MAYQQLQATGNLDVEQYRIPKIYYHGPILEKCSKNNKYFAIAMTLFDETLGIRFEHQKKHFTEPTILLIFKQAVSKHKKFFFKFFYL